ncbi:Protein of unknown function (DUF2499) [Seminavis robusta]|uniref:Uncharacterized protein n=1 Tax=Seminavis robusta TaxID=568900 RepID=A0A9N8HID2_9STRA|nr:Protein of unknown function (DUF2499) [Seminavis robusta]|eukprot:Sro587_g171380.1 Protein of unknown function (DUF2499) (422) ;mRNA; f:51263-52625
MNMIPMEALSSAPPDILSGGIESLASSTEHLSSILSMSTDEAEALGGPLFGFSLFPYLAFLYFLSREETNCPKGVTVGFATLLLFVFLTIPAAICAKLQFGVSLADSDWLHGSAESLLTITNLVTVVAFRQALNAKEQQAETMPASAESYGPMIALAIPLILLAGVTAFVPGLSGAEVHAPYLNGFMDLPYNFFADNLGANPEPANALTVATWIIHISSLVEFLVAMGFAWRWADVSNNPTWKGLTWGLLPLHSSGITACTYHLFYNGIPVMVPLQAFLTCLGNVTAAYAAFRIARYEGWKPEEELDGALAWANAFLSDDAETSSTSSRNDNTQIREESASLVGFEDLGNALKGDTDFSFVVKLFVGCAVASYGVKYGATFFDFPYDANVYLGLAVILVPSALNAFKWYKRGLDPTFEGWF